MEKQGVGGGGGGGGMETGVHMQLMPFLNRSESTPIYFTLPQSSSNESWIANRLETKSNQSLS